MAVLIDQNTKVICRSLLVLCLGLVVGAFFEPSKAIAAERADFELARELSHVCQIHFSDRKTAAKTFKTMGLKTISHNSKFRTSSGNNGRVAVSVGQTRNWIGCVVIVKQMTLVEAKKIAAPWIKQIIGKPSKPRNGAAVWIGAYGDNLARVEIGNIQNPIIIGTGITFEVSRRLKSGTQLKY